MHKRGQEELIKLSQKQQIIIAAYLENKAKKAIARELPLL
jgi:hypothetical protein